MCFARTSVFLSQLKKKKKKAGSTPCELFQKTQLTSTPGTDSSMPVSHLLCPLELGEMPLVSLGALYLGNTKSQMYSINLTGSNAKKRRKRKERRRRRKGEEEKNIQ